MLQLFDEYQRFCEYSEAHVFDLRTSRLSDVTGLLAPNLGAPDYSELLTGRDFTLRRIRELVTRL